MQPDIEIYLLSCKTRSILDWLDKQFTILHNPITQGTSTSLTVGHNNNSIKVVILEEAAGKRFTSVWFDSSHTPWKDDLECAKQAFHDLDCEVRCNYNSWAEEDDSDPDQWWCINHHKEGPFIWK